MRLGLALKAIEKTITDKCIQNTQKNTSVTITMKKQTHGVLGYFVWFLVLLRQDSPYIAKTGLTFGILLLQPPKCWGDTHEPSHLA